MLKSTLDDTADKRQYATEFTGFRRNPPVCAGIQQCSPESTWTHQVHFKRLVERIQILATGQADCGTQEDALSIFLSVYIYSALASIRSSSMLFLIVR